jgi:hypothetical protein
MKKTIVAAAVAAVVSAPAMADLSISGQINQEFSSIGKASTSVVDAGLVQDQNVDIVFKASEDLGNGMKIGAVIGYVTDNNSSNNVTATGAGGQSNASFGAADQYITLSGDFGTIKTGKFEDFTEGKLSAMMALDPVDSMSIEDSRGETARTEGGIAYVSPSFNGLTVGVGAYALNTGSGQASDFDATDVFVSYSNSGLTVMASQEKVEATTVGNTDKKTTMIGVEYKMGDLTARVVDRSVDDNGTSADYESTYYGVKYQMGANAFSVEKINEGKTGAVDATVVSVNHAMSKNANVYLGIKNSDASAEDQTTVGIQYKF